VFAKVLPSTKTLPPATSALLEKLRTAMPELATATPTAAADSERSGPKDDIGAFLHRLTRDGGRRGRIAVGVVDPQVDRDAGLFRRGETGRVFQRPGDDRVTALR
jgi:hypothetical protein